MTDTAEWQCIHTVGFPANRQTRKGFMYYWQVMRRVAARDGDVYGEMTEHRRIFVLFIVNLTVLGLIYGVASAGLSQVVLARLSAGSAGARFSPLAVTVVGVLAVYLLHGASALFVWVFCRGLGGRSRLTPYYLNMGVAGIALWPVAPAVACVQVGLGGAYLVAAVFMAGAWGAAVQYAAVQAASGLSHAKMTAAVIATLTYIGCFLYLWI
ncbi:MAG: hypothetical protein ABIL58_28590 [Pseudomonadota bacterium]